MPNLSHNLLECFAKNEHIKVGHLPLLPCIRGTRSISQSCRTCLCICPLQMQKNHQDKYIQKYLNECSHLSRLFAFWILSYPFWICFMFRKLNQSQNSGWTNSARKTPWVPPLHQSQWALFPTNGSEAGGRGLISQCAIKTECKYCTAALTITAYW